MARFKGLSETIQEIVNRSNTNVDVPEGSPLAVQFGVNLSNLNEKQTPKGRFKWGISTWGIDKPGSTNE